MVLIPTEHFRIGPEITKFYSNYITASSEQTQPYHA